MRKFLLCLALCLLTGCVALYDPVKGDRIKPSADAERVVRRTGEASGNLTAEIVLAALAAGAWFHNRRTIKKHIREKH